MGNVQCARLRVSISVQTSSKIDSQQCYRCLWITLDHVGPRLQFRFSESRLDTPQETNSTEDQFSSTLVCRYTAVLFTTSNPSCPTGGPGGSGVWLISGAGPSFQRLIGEEYDIVGFDPRGDTGGEMTASTRYDAEQTAPHTHPGAPVAPSGRGSASEERPATQRSAACRTGQPRGCFLHGSARQLVSLASLHKHDEC